jgi:hypothetical protein
MSISTALVPVVTVPVRRNGRWWVAEVTDEGVWTRGRTLTEVGDRAHAAIALARGIDPGLIAVRVAVDCPELEVLVQARRREREALAAAVVTLRAQHVPWPETAAVLQVSQREARDAWETAIASP